MASVVALTAIPVKQCVVSSMQIYPSSVRVQGSTICIDVITASQLRTDMIASIEASWFVQVVVAVPGRAVITNAPAANKASE